MPKEIPSSSSEILDVKTLSPQSKMRYVLDVFDLGKDKEKNEERKRNFIELIGRYNNMYIKSNLNISTGKEGERYEAGRAELHNKIMEILTNMSLSMGLTKEQMEVISYLSKNRDEVSRMISSYFANYDTSKPNQLSEYQMAHRGEGLFRSIPNKEDN